MTCHDMSCQVMLGHIMSSCHKMLCNVIRKPYLYSIRFRILVFAVLLVRCCNSCPIILFENIDNLMKFKQTIITFIIKELNPSYQINFTLSSTVFTPSDKYFYPVLH